MKYFNFFKTISAQEQSRLHTWIIISACLTIILIVVMIILHGIQIQALYTIYQEKKRLHIQAALYDTLIQKKESYLIQSGHLNKYITKLTHHNEQPAVMANTLEQIFTTCKSPISMMGLEIKKKNIALTILCEKPEQALILAQQLSQLPSCTSMAVTSIYQHASKNISCVLQGTLK